MNVQEIIEAFRNGLMWIGLSALVALAVCALLLLAAKNKLSLKNITLKTLFLRDPQFAKIESGRLRHFLL